MKTDAGDLIGKRARVHRGGLDNFNPTGTVWQVDAGTPSMVPFFELFLEDVEFVVDREKRAEGLQKRTRVTHAFAVGVFLGSELPDLPGGCVEVFYHVFSGPGVFETSDGLEVHHAQMLFLTREGRCFAWRLNA